MRESKRYSKVAVEIRQAREGDEQPILKCLAEAFEPYREQYTAGAYADTVIDEGALSARMQTMHVLVAISNGEIIGTVAGTESHPGEGHLRGMAVLPQYKGSGVSAELLAAIEAWLRARGCVRVTLDTTQPLLTAMRFYEKHGYVRSGHVSDFFGMALIENVKDIR
ncbi:MAG TPA: GNAT family N-acetyltransferase [Terriglobales bacterium]|nr:GNAT family N-acetyltransferase [Terriglobales bacterium]